MINLQEDKTISTLEAFLLILMVTPMGLALILTVFMLPILLIQSITGYRIIEHIHIFFGSLI